MIRRERFLKTTKRWNKSTEFSELRIHSSMLYKKLGEGYLVAYRDHNQSELPDIRIEGEELIVLMHRPAKEDPLKTS